MHVSSVRYKNLPSLPLYVVWERRGKEKASREGQHTHRKEEWSRPNEEHAIHLFVLLCALCLVCCAVLGSKGVYDFLDLDGNPPDPQPPLTFVVTMYDKKGKYLPKKSKLFLRYKQKSAGGSELVSEDISIPIPIPRERQRLSQNIE